MTLVSDIYYMLACAAFFVSAPLLHMIIIKEVELYAYFFFV